MSQWTSIAFIIFFLLSIFWTYIKDYIRSIEVHEAVVVALTLYSIIIISIRIIGFFYDVPLFLAGNIVVCIFCNFGHWVNLSIKWEKYDETISKF